MRKRDRVVKGRKNKKKKKKYKHGKKIQETVKKQSSRPVNVQKSELEGQRKEIREIK